MFVCMDAIRRERLSLGELSPVGRLRGVGVMYMSYFVVTPLRHRCAMPPLPKERQKGQTKAHTSNLYIAVKI